MEWIKVLLDILLHIDVHLSAIIQHCGVWTYGVLFLIIFCETGLVVTPFLPGDSLLFAAGMFAGTGSLNLLTLAGVLAFAAIAGDTVNYWVGYLLGPKMFHESNGRLFRKEYLDRTHEFYERYGGKTIVLARFIPIVRTFAPFVAGIARMDYGRFLGYNVLGGCFWIAIFVFGGSYFRDLPIVRENFSLVILLIIVASVSPGVGEFIRHHRKRTSRG